MVSACLASGCSGGLLHGSMLTDLRVLALQAEPAQPAPGEALFLDVSVGAPIARDLELAVWSCTAIEGDCAELWLDDDAAWMATPTVIDRHASVAWQTPADVDAWVDLIDHRAEDLLEDGLVRLWALACEVDQCPVIADIRAQLDRGTSLDADDPLALDLADPTRWMVDLPKSGVSLASRSLPVRLEGEPNLNPDIIERFLPTGAEAIEVAAGDVAQLSFLNENRQDNTFTGYPMTTLGRFDVRSRKSSDPAMNFQLAAPDEPGEGDVWVVFADGQGGYDVWHSPLVVR